MEEDTVDFNEFLHVKKLTYSRAKYTSEYRFIKSILLVLTWISFGFNYELIGITFEDLKVYLNVNYASISIGPVLRNIGYLTLTLFLGLILERIERYSDVLMAFASGIIALTSFLMPVTKNFNLSMSYFLVQGLAQSVYDLTGISIMLNLWKDFGGSPLNNLQGGYGIGACIATQLANPLISFNRQSEFNSTAINNGTVEADYVNLKDPYWRASCFSGIIAFCFIISQFFETRNNKEHEVNRRNYMLLMEDTSDASSDSESNKQNLDFSNSVQKLLFSETVYKGKALIYMLTQIFLFIILFVFAQGYFTIITRFMFTFLTRGPAEIATKTSQTIEMFFWIIIICSRFLSAILTTYIKPSNFFIVILSFNTLITALFLIPISHEYQGFYWILVPLLGFTSGPIIPCGLDLAKQMLKINSFILSIFIVGLASGGIIFQEVCGSLLDKQWIVFINQKSIIPYLSFFTSLTTFLVYLQIYSIHRVFYHLV